MGTHPIFESDFDCLTEADERVMLAMARIDEKVGLSTVSKSRASQNHDHPPLKMKLPSRVERKCGEWCEVQSKTKKKIYYLNIRTKETTWKKPPGWCDKTADRIGSLKKSLKDSPSLSTDSSSQDAPFPAPVSVQTPTPRANNHHHRRKSSPHSHSHKSETPKHRSSNSSSRYKHSSDNSRKSRKRSPPRMNSSLNSSSSISTTDSSIPSTPKSTRTTTSEEKTIRLPENPAFDPLKNAEKEKEERDREIDKIYSSKILKIQQLERRHRMMSKLEIENSFPENNDKILRQHQNLVCESIPSRIQELVYNKKEKQADFYSRENSRNSHKTSECSGEIARLKYKLRSRSFLINSVDGFCSLQRQRAEALMLSSFSSNFDSPERPAS